MRRIRANTHELSNNECIQNLEFSKSVTTALDALLQGKGLFDEMGGYSKDSFGK